MRQDIITSITDHNNSTSQPICVFDASLISEVTHKFLRDESGLFPKLINGDQTYSLFKGRGFPSSITVLGYCAEAESDTTSVTVRISFERFKNNVSIGALALERVISADQIEKSGDAYPSTITMTLGDLTNLIVTEEEYELSTVPFSDDFDGFMLRGFTDDYDSIRISCSAVGMNEPQEDDPYDIYYFSMANVTMSRFPAGLC